MAQRTFERVIRRGGLQSVSSSEAYLWRMAKNIRVSALRAMAARNRRDRALETLFFADGSYLESPERVFEARETMNIAVNAIKAMPDDRRRAFLMVRFDGMEHKEVARVLGVSRPAVSRHVAKAMRDITQALEDDAGSQ